MAAGLVCSSIILHHESASRAYLLHYREEYAEKQRRKSGAGRVRSWAEFDAVNELSVHDCTDAAERYGPYP